MKRLIVNADDFGLTLGVNRAIVECHKNGIVTSATLMANSAAFADAVKLAHATPSLGIGCHVVLLDGDLLLPAEGVRSLLKDGREPYRSITDFAPRAALGKFNPDEIEAEATAQFQKIQRAGINITHFDAHKHAHMFASVLEPLLRAATKCGIPAVRNPFERPLALPLKTVLSDIKFAFRWTEVVALRSLYCQWMRLIHKYGFSTTDGSIGIAATGSLCSDTLRNLLDRMEDGNWELVCHPGYNDTDLGTIQTKLRGSREIEREVLTAEETLLDVEKKRIRLMQFTALTSVSASF